MTTTTITATITETRANAETQFFGMSPAELEYRNQNFVKTGKILFTKKELSDDTLTRKLITIFLNAAARLEYRNDPVISDFRLRKTEYNAANNITSDFDFDIE
jgi:hypothetical protein